MDTKAHELLALGKLRLASIHCLCLGLLVSVLCLITSFAQAATFSGNSRVEIADPSGGLTWNGANNALSVQCWFKLVIPSGTNLTENMTILVNRRSGTTNDQHAFLIWFNIYTGDIEFSTKGGSGSFVRTLIERPYLERWYHVAVVREGESFTGYADGRQVFSASGSVGGAGGDGVAVGGWGASQYLYGEVQELSIYQSPIDRNFINQYMFTDQPTNNEPGVNLKGYFKLACSTNAADRLRNFAPAPVPSGTETATTTGTVEFEETNQAGEQSTFDSRRNGGRDALAPLSGAFSWNQTAFSRPTPGIAFDLRLGYASANAFGGFKLGNADPYSAGPLGKGWRHTFEARIVPSQDFLPHGSIETIGLMSWDGSLETWDGETNEFGLLTGAYRTRHKEYRGELYLTNSLCEWRTAERLLYRFRRPDSFPLTQRGLLFEIRDFNSNSLQILRNSSGAITQVVDSARGSYDFQYRGALLTNLVFGPWQVRFDYDPTNRLISKSITNTSGIHTNINTAWQFSYSPSNGLLERITDPRGNTNVFVQYDKYGRKTNEVDAIGRAARTAYGTPGKRDIKHTDPGGFEWIETYDRKHRLLVQRDPLGNETRYAYDDAGNRTGITEPLGYTTFFGYDSRANVVARTNALFEVTRWAFHGFFNKAVAETNAEGWVNHYVIDNATGNLLRHFDAIGDLVRYTYLSNGLVDSSIDANGNTNRFFYDTNGFLIRKVDAAGRPMTYGYNEVGWKLAETNALGETMHYTLDLNGNVVRTVDGLQRVFTRTYDANGNLTSQSDAKGQLTRHFFDAANQRTQTVDRAGFAWTNTYTSRGELFTASDPLGNSATNFHDPANRLTNTADALGGSVQRIYDANGKETAMIDKVGQRWSKTYDRLNRVIAETDPQGDTKRTTYDPVGRIKEIVTPRGFPSTHFYDGRGRLTNWVDAEGFAWRYDYDGNGNITNITDALGGRYVMAYSNRNERILERNQDNFEWRYTYDELLRLKTQRDPNGTTRTLDYDAGGRVLSVTFNTGRVNSFLYDENNNPEVLSRTGSGPPTISQLAYDELDRVREYRDAFGKRIRYTFDPRGRVSSLTYPDGRVLINRYDAISRLTNQLFNAQHELAYAYDAADRLIRRTYPNGVVQSNAFDTAGQLTSLQYSAASNQPPSSNAISIALTYAYDRNGNKTASTEKGTLDWPLPSLTDERARYTASGRLIDRTISSLSPTGGEGQGEGAINYSYDPSGNMTNAAGNGQSWRLTYDEDNRTTSILWDAGITSKLVTNRYDALGRRVAKTVDGVQTGYVLDLAGSMERILCDLAPNGAITAWYVHGPDLSFKVDAAGTLTCYHADAQANIIALTGAGGTNLALYAYTPYGRSLGTTNYGPLTTDSNPYLFVGSQGVMEELPGLYFMRARYYSAEATAFLSTDPMKRIGPGWKPVAFAYAEGNPFNRIDPEGELAWTHAAFFVGGVAAELLTSAAKNSIAESVGQIAENVIGMAEDIGTREIIDEEAVGDLFTQGLKTIFQAQGLAGFANDASVAAKDKTGHAAAFYAGKWVTKGLRLVAELPKRKPTGITANMLISEDAVDAGKKASSLNARQRADGKPPTGSAPTTASGAGHRIDRSSPEWQKTYSEVYAKWEAAQPKDQGKQGTPTEAKPKITKNPIKWIKSKVAKRK